jgi:LPXTG-motif cell wall-anchored protein
MGSSSVNVFVCYSHADTALVAPVVSLLRVNQSLVFQDIDRIRPGKKWRDEIAKALDDSSLVVVFWCHHAAQSLEMQHEWKAAIAQQKDLLPLLLDATPLPAQLSAFQWIDFRGTVGAQHGAADSQAHPKLRSRSGLWIPFVGIGATAVVASAALFVLTRTVPETPLPSPLPETDHASSAWLSLMVIGGAAIALYFWLRRRARRSSSANVGQPHSQMQRHIAAAVEAEIVRRAARYSA